MGRNLTKGQTIVGLLFGALFIWYFVSPSGDSTPQPKAEEPAKTAAVAHSPAVDSPPPPPVDAIPDTLTTLPEAIKEILPKMTDTSEEMSQGAIDLGLWAAAAPVRWDELMALPRTKAALVFKDADEERGKLLCAQGEIIEISAARAGAEKVYQGGIGDVSSGVIVRFVAIGSTGNLVQGSNGAFCGVVTGRYDYANSVGGVTHAIQLVGMFNLPSNVKPRQS